MDNRSLGSWGEDRACKYLILHGYRVLSRNFRCRMGEIDIIARKGNYIVFVEVKLRKNDKFAQAREFVTNAKQQRIITTAQIWLSMNKCELQPRFDIIEIYAPQGPAGRIKTVHIENAFE